MAAGLLASARGKQTEIRAAELIWNRRHIVRLHLGDDRSVVLKRRGDQPAQSGQGRSFGVELAALEYLNAMPVPVAPQLLGANLSAATRTAVTRATSGGQAVTLLLAAPEFMRR